MSKISIQFHKDREVRAVWDEEKSKWWFSAVDIVAAITDSSNPRKYWSVMKTRMKKVGNKLITKCSQLKLSAATPSKRSTDFLDKFTYSDNTIDGQSRKKAHSLFESGMLVCRDECCPSIYGGNGRSTRIWLDLMFGHSLKKCVNWSKIDKNDYFYTILRTLPKMTYAQQSWLKAKDICTVEIVF